MRHESPFSERSGLGTRIVRERLGKESNLSSRFAPYNSSDPITLQKYMHSDFSMFIIYIENLVRKADITR
jgi:hypothetical protein